MKKITTVKIGTNGLFYLNNRVLDSFKYKDFVHYGNMEGVVFISEEDFNDSVKRKINRNKSTGFNIPALLLQQLQIYQGQMCNLYEDNRDIFIIPVEEEKEALLRLGATATE